MKSVKNEDDLYKEFENLINSNETKSIKSLFNKANVNKKFNNFLKIISYVKSLVNSTSYINEIKNGYNFYELALKEKKVNIIVDLLESPIFKSYNEKNKRSILMDFIKVENDFFKKLIKTEKVRSMLSEEIFIDLCENCIHIDEIENLKDLINLNFNCFDKNKEKLFTTAIEFNATKIIKGMLNGSLSYGIDINKLYEKFDIDGFVTQKTALTNACKDKNKDLIEYLLLSPELKEHAQFSENYMLIMELKNKKEIMEFIILNLNIPLDTQIKHNIQNVYANDSEIQDIIDIFNKREMKDDLEKKLPIKGKKTKSLKI